MEKVPAVLRILCDLWRISLTTKTPQHREAVRKFTTWVQKNEKQPSLVAIKEAIGFFPTRGRTGHFVKMANEWANSQPCVAMKPVIKGGFSKGVRVKMRLFCNLSKLNCYFEHKAVKQGVHLRHS